MKKYISLFAILLVLGGCEKDEIETWSELSYVWFYVNKYSSDGPVVLPTKSFSFRMADPEDLFTEDGMTAGYVLFPLVTAGTPSNKDRIVNVEVEQDKSNSQTRYELMKPVIIPAGELSGVMKVKIFKTPNLDNDADSVSFVIKDSEDLLVAQPWAYGEPMDCLVSKMIVMSRYAQPSWWTSTWTNTYWGPFTQEKMDVVYIVLGSLDNPNPGDTPIFQYNVYLINQYIEEHNCTEADGTPMAKIINV